MRELNSARTVFAQLTVAAVLLAASVPAFYQQSVGSRISDIPAHFAIGYSDSQSSYSVLYYLVEGLILLGTGEVSRGWFATIVLSVCVALKGVLTFRFLFASERIVCTAFVAVILAFTMPIVNWWHYQSVYPGQIAPNVWHNSTMIMQMPLAILLLRASLDCLQDPCGGKVGRTAALSVLGAAIKPSYVIIWLPVFGSWFSRSGWRCGVPLPRILTRIAIIVFPTAILLLGQSALLAKNVGVHVILSPLGVWTLYTPHPVFSILLSIAFPAAVLILFRDAIGRDIGLQFSWIVFIVSLLPFMLLAESGDRFGHGNFFWGSYIALYLVFLCSADITLRQPTSRRTVLAYAFLALHLVSGLYYYGRIVCGLGYM